MLPVALVHFAAPVIAVAPLRAEGGGVSVRLRADGLIVDVHGSEIGAVEGAELRIGRRGLFFVGGSDNVYSTYFADGRFDADDGLVFDAREGRMRLSIDDDGVVFLETSGETRPSGLRVSGVTASSRRTALLLALAVFEIREVGFPDPPARLTLTLDPLALINPYVQLTSELRVDKRWSLALHVGGGLRWNDRAPGVKSTSTTAAWEFGVEPRWFFLGGFTKGAYLGWRTHFARGKDGTLGFASTQPPPGLSSGLMVGYKLEFFAHFTPDFGVGVLCPILTPAHEPTHPPAVLVVRFAIGVSF